MKRGWHPVHKRGGHRLPLVPYSGELTCETVIPSDQVLCTPSEPGERCPVINMSNGGTVGETYWLVADGKGGWKREEWDHEC